MLGDVIEVDDGYMAPAARACVTLSLDTGRLMGLDADRPHNLEFDALLHGVGKVAVPEAIINKTGRLDREEWAIVQAHAAEGQALLDRIGGFMPAVGGIVRSHHERRDGTGFPDGVRGEEIPLGSRIAAEGIEELRRGAGTQFDRRWSMRSCARDPGPRPRGAHRRGRRRGAVSLPGEVGAAGFEPATSRV